jgi:hypothetical protein
MNINFKKPWLIGLAISLPFFLMATVSLATAQMSKLICQRVESGQAICELTRVDWLGKTSTKTWQTNEIQKIEFIDDRQQIRLLTQTGEIILMPFYNTGVGRRSRKWYKQSIVKRMEAFFLNNLEAEQNLMIEQDKRGGGYIDGIFFILIGLTCVMGGLDYSINMKKRIK